MIKNIKIHFLSLFLRTVNQLSYYLQDLILVITDKIILASFFSKRKRGFIGFYLALFH